MRVALLVSGHLRDLCLNENNFAPFANAVTGCRSLARCDLFMVTWDVLHPVSQGDIVNSSSFPCLHRIQQRLQPLAISAEKQPLISPLFGNTSWVRYRDSAVKKRTTSVKLSGIHSMIYAAAAVDALKERYCANMCVNQTHDIVVRMRPDLYPVAGKDWTTFSLPHTHTWPLIVKTAQAGAMLGAGALNTTIFSCSKLRLPGDKSADACFWGSSVAMSRVLRTWEALATPWLKNNMCWGEWYFSSSPSSRPSPNLCGPRATCSDSVGCLSEAVLAHAIELVGLQRGLAKQGAGQQIMTSWSVPQSVELHAALSTQLASLLT